MIRVVAPIARATLLESVRSRLLWVALVLCACALGAAGFLHQLAIIEARELKSVVLAAGLRTGAVFLMTAFVCMSMVREYNDKVFELMLAGAWPRAVYLLGKFVGFSTAAVGLAVVVSLPLALFAPLGALVPWTISLACELLLMTAATLFFVVTLTHVVPALTAVLGFYLLARSLAAIQIVAGGGSSTAWTDRIANGMVSALATVLPRLDLMTRSEWLAGAALPPGDFATTVLPALVYAALLLAAAQFDLHRQNF